MFVIGLPGLAENEMTSTKKGWHPIANPFNFLKMVRYSILNGTPAVKFNELYGLYGLIDLQSTTNEIVNLVTSSINLIPKHL